MSGAKKPAPTLMHNLGEFVGHVVAGIKSDVGTPTAQAETPVVVREQVQEREHVTPEGQRLILRRRTIDEVVVPVDEVAAAARGAGKAADL